LKRLEKDPQHFTPDAVTFEKVLGEIKISGEEFSREFERYKSERVDEPVYYVDVIDMGPDWWNSIVTPEKIKWHLDRGLSFEQTAEKLRRTIKTIKKTLARIDEHPREKPIAEVPYGWRLTKKDYQPDEVEQWVIKKIEDDRSCGKKFEEIAAQLSKIGVKPRGGGLWFARRLSMTLKENTAMWSAHKVHKALLFLSGRKTAG
jgi:hypothetical protein